MVEYTVEVHSTTAFTLEEIYIKLIGSICDSKPQVLYTFSLSSVSLLYAACQKIENTFPSFGIVHIMLDFHHFSCTGWHPSL